METMEAGKGLHRLVWQASSQARIRDKILPSPSRLSAPCKVPAGSESENESLSVVSDSLRPLGLYSPQNSPGQTTRVGSLFLLQGIFPTQGSNPGLPHCRQILYQLSHKGSPRTVSLFLLQWIFLTQDLNRGILHCRWILYQLSYHEGHGKDDWTLKDQEVRLTKERPQGPVGQDCLVPRGSGAGPH